MDAFKFAFETTIVGLLTLPWLACAILLLLPMKELPKTSSSSPLSKLLEPTALGIAVVTLAYFMGSAVSPLANQLLDDQDIPIVTIREIHASALQTYEAWVNTGASSISPQQALFNKMSQAFFNDAKRRRCTKSRDDAVACQQQANDLFLFQEQALLRDGTDKTERVNRLHEQVIVLRGAVFNGLVLVVLSWYAYFSRPYNQPLGRIASDPRALVNTVLTVAMASTLIGIAFHYGEPDVFKHAVDDPPIMESGLLVLGLVGVRTAWKGVVERSYLPVLVLSLIMMALAFGAWWWTEYLYTRDVIGAFAVRS